MKEHYGTTNPVKIINQKIKEGYTLCGIDSWDLEEGGRNYILTFIEPAKPKEKGWPNVSLKFEKRDWQPY
jgi:hypothetical protein